MSVAPDKKHDAMVLKIFEYRDALLAYAFTILRDWQLAEDALQETVLVVLNRDAEAEPVRDLFAWVRRVLRNKCMETIRSRTRETTNEQERLQALVTEACDAYLDEDSAAGLKKMKQALRHCMGKLRSGSLDLLVGFYYRMQSCKHLAEQQGRSVNAVKLALSRTRDRLRVCVQRQLPLLDAET